MALRLGFVAVGQLLATLFFLTGCGSSEDTEPPGVGGGPISAPGYPTPRSTGYWSPPALDPRNFEENIAVDESEVPKAFLTGDINGFRFFGPGEPAKEYPCDPAKSTLLPPQDRDLPIEVAHFPPGTVEQTPRIQVCPDGTLQLAVRSFQVATTAFSVSYHGGELAVYNDSIREGRGEAATMKGSRAVFVEPLTSDGYGESMILWDTTNGYVRVYAIDLPFDEVLKIANSVQCRKC